MNEQSLAKSIDKLANSKAEALLRGIREAVNNALKPYWRHKDACEELHIDDIKNALTEYIASIGKDKSYKYQPSAELVNSCRARILSDLLRGLPKLNEIAAMAAQYEQPDDYQGAGHYDHHQDD